MQSISTEYMRSTKSVVATTAAGHRITLPWNDSLDMEQNHKAAAQVLIKKLGWWKISGLDGDWYFGASRDGKGYNYVFAKQDTKLNLE